MIGVELSMEIRVLAKHGKGVREIAREVGVSRNTVRRYLRDPDAVRYKGRPQRPVKLEPFKTYGKRSLYPLSGGTAFGLIHSHRVADRWGESFAGKSAVFVGRWSEDCRAAGGA